MKVFSCVCGSKQFTLVKRTYTVVDFSQEGAVEGHPFIRSSGELFNNFLCYECGAEVPDEQAQEMFKEVV